MHRQASGGDGGADPPISVAARLRLGLGSGAEMNGSCLSPFWIISLISAIILPENP